MILSRLLKSTILVTSFFSLQHPLYSAPDDSFDNKSSQAHPAPKASEDVEKEIRSEIHSALKALDLDKLEELLPKIDPKDSPLKGMSMFHGILELQYLTNERHSFIQSQDDPNVDKASIQTQLKIMDRLARAGLYPNKTVLLPTSNFGFGFPSLLARSLLYGADPNNGTGGRYYNGWLPIYYRYRGPVSSFKLTTTPEKTFKSGTFCYQADPLSTFISINEGHGFVPYAFVSSDPITQLPDGLKPEDQIFVTIGYADIMRRTFADFRDMIEKGDGDYIRLHPETKKALQWVAKEEGIDFSILEQKIEKTREFRPLRDKYKAEKAELKKLLKKDVTLKRE